MSPVRCPSGHESTATDYCDVCGAPIGPDAQAPAQVPATGASELDLGTPPPAPAPSSPGGDAASQTCPHCGTINSPRALFCEACGYDFTTGTLPRSAAATAAPSPSEPASSVPTPAPVAPAVPLEWVVEVWVDPDWYAEQDSPEVCPSPGLPVVLPLRVRSVLVGRTSASRNIHPDIPCEADSAVSRRHAQLSTDGTRWWVEDLNSSNGTFVGPASGPLPVDPLVPGQRRELAEDDRIYLGAWTRLVVRRATAEEQAAG